MKHLMLRNYKKPNICSRKVGAVTLFFCLITGIICSLLLICFKSAAERSDETEMIRAGQAAADVSLAAYDLDLLENFGIWGLDNKRITTDAFYALANTRLQAADVYIESAGNVFAQDYLLNQITSFMQVRAPAGWINRFAAELRTAGESVGGIHQENRSISSSGQLKNIFENEMPDIDEIMDFQMQMQEQMYKLIPYNLTISSVREGLKWILSPIIKPLEEFSEDLFEEVVTSIFEDCLPVYPEDFGLETSIVASGTVPDFLNPAVIAALSAAVDSLIKPAANLEWEKLLLMEYCISCFPARITSYDFNAPEQIELKSPSGEAHDSLVYLQNSNDDLKTGKKVKRVNELEKIITNEDDGEKAVKRIEGNILMLRSIIRMLETITDQSRLEEYRPAAGMLSACITAASAGSVYIDTETLVWILAVADAVRMGVQDTEDLVSGKRVALWTYHDESTIELVYHDYLRMFLLAVPQDELLESIGKQIRNLLPGEYASAVAVNMTWHGNSINIIKGYRLYANNGDSSEQR
jgi:hypothetical protein